MSSQIKTPWKKITHVLVNDNFTLKLEWDDGCQSEISLKSRIHQKEIFRRLRNPRYFKQVSIDPLGGICWPEGEDLSPIALANLDHVK